MVFLGNIMELHYLTGRIGGDGNIIVFVCNDSIITTNTTVSCLSVGVQCDRIKAIQKMLIIMQEEGADQVG